MREIKFRGYAVEEMVNSQWIEGFGVSQLKFAEHYAKEVERDSDWWIYTESGDFRVDPKSIGQYTGLKDKNGKEIYEGDIIRTWEEDEHKPNRDSGGGIIDFDKIGGFSQLGVVSFKGAWFTYETKKYLAGRKEIIYAPLDFTNDLVVVGNIHENPELLES